MHKRIVTTLLLLVVLAGCKSATTPTPTTVPAPPPATASAPTAGTIRDLEVLPQDCTYYANSHQGESDSQRPRFDPLLSHERQSQLAAAYRRMWYAVWAQGQAPAKADIARGFDALAAAPGYGENLLPITPKFIQQMKDAANLDAYPAVNQACIATRNTSLRQVPTMLPRFEDIHKAGSEYPFDTFQETALAIGTPMRVWHLSKGGDWALVSTPLSDGWVQRADIAVMPAPLLERWRGLPLAAVTQDDLVLTEGRYSVPVHIGTVLPMAARQDGRITLLVPAGSGVAEAREMQVTGGVCLMPREMTNASVGELANQMLGQPYGWGGMYELRDCSSTMRDLMTPFGIFLPRNSAAQAAAYRRVDLTGLTGEEKERRVLKEGKPFMTLLGFPGHIGLYLGQHDGRAIMLHNFWGIRTRVDGVEGRHVIGRCAITTLQPGKELPNYDPVKADYRTKLQSMTFIGE